MDIELTRVTLGIDRLYRIQADSGGVLDREGLVPVALANVEPEQFDTWDDADKRLIKLAGDLYAIADALRRAYLTEMIDSLRGIVATFRGDPLEYVARVRQCLRVDPSPVPPEMIEQCRAEIDRLLEQMGYVQGPLSERVARWEEECRVPAEKIPLMLSELLDTAQARTDKYIFKVPDVPGIEPVGVRGVPFSAYCDYPGRQLRINLDHIYTRGALKHLACHEAYPGHLVHLAVREHRTKSGAMPLDAALVVTNSASSAIFEGIGENGIHFLNWIEDSGDQLAMTLNRLRSAARVNAALLIHQEGRPLEQVKTYLRETCFGTPAWVESRLAFITHRLRAPFIFAYWCGDMAVAKVWGRLESSERPQFFRYLYHHMHTATTLDRFWPLVQEEHAIRSVNTDSKEERG